MVNFEVTINLSQTCLFKKAEHAAFKQGENSKPIKKPTTYVFLAYVSSTHKKLIESRQCI